MSAETIATRTVEAPAGVLHIAQPVVLLDDQPAHGELVSNGRVIIHADIVKVRGRCFLPGHAVEIVARRIEADHGTIDVSGAPAKSYDPEKPEPSLNGIPDGTGESVDGKDGAAGEDGHNAGSLTIMAGEIAGDLRLVANGSTGGSGQRGGDGAKPKKAKDGRDGEFTAHEPPVGKFGAYVVRDYGSRWYWEMAHGEKGGNAGAGGRAGAAGKPGNGGTGGDIQLIYVADPSTPPNLEANGASAGAMGVPGKPGPAGEPGIGGKNRLYQYHWPCQRWEKYADDGDSDVREIVGRFGLAHHAASGDPAKPGEVPPNPAPGVDGAAGSTKSARISAADLHLAIGLDYLEFMLRIAEEDAECGNIPRALERYQWLQQLTPDTAELSERRWALHQEATRRIEKFRKQVEEEKLVSG